jgi:hypothetical protein
MSVGVNPPKTPVTEGSNGIAAATLPNVCKMPGPPAPFVPTPLPNIGKSGSSPQGYSTSVKIEGNAVAIQGATFTSMGDVASQGTGGGLVSSNVQGPTSFVAPGSLDVAIEGKNVQQLGDQMLNNCGPSGSPANSATMGGTIQAPTAAAFAKGPVLCGEDSEKCVLSTWHPNKCPKNADGTQKTPHHIIPKHCFKKVGGGTIAGWPNYNADKAACICVSGKSKTAGTQHGRIHDTVDLAEGVAGFTQNGQWSFAQAKDAGCEAVKKEIEECDLGCLKIAIDETHKGNKDKPLRADCPKGETSKMRQKVLAFLKPGIPAK